MALHPQAARFRQQWLALGPPRTERSTPEEIRAVMRGAIAVNAIAVPGVETEEAAFSGPAGPLPVRVYRPSGGGTGRGVAFIHGGGWVAGDLDTHDALCRALAAAGEAVVASVDYRRAPEHRFPAALDDAYAVLQQFAAEAPRWGVDARRIAVAGDSAGGNLAAAVCLMARDRGKHVPAQQLLIYPIVSAEFSTPSYARYEDGYVLTRRAMEWFWDQYAPAIADRAHPYATPLHADLAGLPPALVVTAGHDVLCSEGAAYAERLAASGTPAEYFDYPGMLHGFLHRLSMFDDARDLVARLGRFLQAL